MQSPNSQNRLCEALLLLIEACSPKNYCHMLFECQQRCRAPIRKIASARLYFCSLRRARQRTIVICSYEDRQRCRAPIRKIASARLCFCSLRRARQRTFAIYSYECQHSTSIRQGSWLCIVAILHKFYIHW